MKKKHCNRCDQDVNGQTMSVFNDDIICPKCVKKEESHKDFNRALIANEFAIKNNNTFWEGIGKPEDL